MGTIIRNGVTYSGGNGVKELTLEEYNAIPTKNKDIVYFIKDADEKDLTTKYNKNLADFYLMNKDYVTGDYCIFNNQLYEFIEDKPAGDWDESKVKEITIKDKIDECFQSVSNGKNLIASAITDMEVETDATATFAEMAENIKSIETGVDTSDATATAAMITEGFTAYVNGQLIMGTRPLPVTSQSGSKTYNTITWGQVVPFSITFDPPFDTVPSVSLANSTCTEHDFDQLKVTSVSRTGFDGKFEPGGTPDMGYSNVVIRWVASTG